MSVLIFGVSLNGVSSGLFVSVIVRNSGFISSIVYSLVEVVCVVCMCFLVL